MINLNNQKLTATYCDIKFCNQVGGIAVPGSNSNYRLAIITKVFLVLFCSTTFPIYFSLIIYQSVLYDLNY